MRPNTFAQLVDFSYVRRVGDMEKYIHYPRFQSSWSLFFFKGFEHPLLWWVYTSMMVIHFLAMGRFCLVDIGPTDFEACHHYMWWTCYCLFCMHAYTWCILGKGYQGVCLIYRYADVVSLSCYDTYDTIWYPIYMSVTPVVVTSLRMIGFLY